MFVGLELDLHTEQKLLKILCSGKCLRYYVGLFCKYDNLFCKKRSFGFIFKPFWHISIAFFILFFLS